MIAAGCAAMLTACQSSPAALNRAPAADPVIHTERRVETVCPPELGQALPPKVAKAAGAEIEGNEAGMAWLRDHLGREGLLEDRLVDAAKACPAPASKGAAGVPGQH